MTDVKKTISVQWLIEILTGSNVSDLELSYVKLDFVKPDEQETLELELEFKNGSKVYIEDECEIESEQENDIDDQRQNDAGDVPPKITRPEDAREYDYSMKAEDLFGLFVSLIDDCLQVNGNRHGASFEYLSATKIRLSVEIDYICGTSTEDEEDSLQVKKIFFNELPNIIKLYESAGWQVSFEKDEATTTDEENVRGDLVFIGELPKSPYRKLLEETS